MFRTMCLCLATLVLATVGFSQTAPASGDTLRFDAPFAFYVGNQPLPAGAYTLQWINSGFAIVAGDRSGGILMVNRGAHDPNGPGASPSRLVFNRYGDTHFLSQVWFGPGIDGLQGVRSKEERRLGSVSSRLIAQGKVQKVTILATLR